MEERTIQDASQLTSCTPECTTRYNIPVGFHLNELPEHMIHDHCNRLLAIIKKRVRIFPGAHDLGLDYATRLESAEAVLGNMRGMCTGHWFRGARKVLSNEEWEQMFDEVMNVHNESASMDAWVKVMYEIEWWWIKGWSDGTDDCII